MILNRDEYRQMVLGCWMGKNIGGTLGAPYEWRRQFNDVSFYTQDLKGEPLPNDDLDIQLLWVIALEQRGVEVDSKVLGEYFLSHVTPHWSEYGVCKINMRSGLMPPLSGEWGNDYKDSCGAFIRSEIWACVAPACPRVAARYAAEDAMIDHGYGEGTYAAMFTASLESAAFVVKDINRLVEIGLSHIPEDCGVAGAVRLAVECYRRRKSWKEARDALLSDYRGMMHPYRPERLSEEDRRKGFADGRRGWDAPSNIGLLVVALLYGEGDFARTVCTAVNCGEDTDCTAATAGSIFGIMHGIQAIPEKWIQPIGRAIKTISINVGDLGWRIPKDVDNLTNRTELLARQVLLRHRLPVEILESRPTDLSKLDPQSLLDSTRGKWFTELGKGPVYRFGAFDVCVDYEDNPAVRNGEAKALAVTIRNNGLMENVNIRWYAPAGWRVLPAASAKVRAPSENLGATKQRIEFRLVPESVEDFISRCAIELTVDGRHSIMLVPVVLINGNAVPGHRSE